MIEPNLLQLRRLLLVRTDRIGDMLITTPCFRALRHALPEATLDVLASSGNAAILTGNPHIDHIHIFNRRNPATWPGLLYTIRARRYEGVLVFNSISRSASFLASLVKAPVRIAVIGLPRYGGTYTWVPTGGTTHHIFHMLSKLESMGIPPQSPQMDFVVPTELSQSMASQYPRQPGHHKLGIFLGNIKKTTKRWPIEKFRLLVEHLLKEVPDVELVLLAGPDDKPLFEAFEDLMHPRLSRFTGQTLQHTGAFLQTCDGLLTGSSGPAHLASALGIPVLGIIIKLDAIWWAPLSPGSDWVIPDTPIHDVRGIPVEPVREMVHNFLTKLRDPTITLVPPQPLQSMED